MSKIASGGLAAQTGRISIGDRLLAVNNVDVTGVTHNEVVNTLVNATKPVTLRIRHEQLPSGWRVSVLCCSMNHCFIFFLHFARNL